MNKRATAILALAILLTAVPAYAYVDPTIGGALVQQVTAGIAGLAILFRLCWRRFRGTPGPEDARSRPAVPPPAFSDRPTDPT
jgi:hypothetical protein